ncbi:MAG TPA: ABC transporter permease [Vicinamibacterales bacterium]|nr:ABC transporter permease [Vicinamibacterales bacterium]
MQDLRYALRTLLKQPVFSLVAVLTLTLGIGANTAIFSLLYQTLLRPLPYPDADRLVFVWNSYKGINLDQASVSIPDYIDRKTQAPAIEDATLFTGRTANLNEGGNPEQLRALAVTPSFFSTLQRQPFLGRGFTDDEARADADKFAVLTYGLWSSHYGADASIVGRDIRVNGVAHRVVGVLPADVDLPNRDIALLLPFAFTPAQMSDNARGNEFSQMIARLRKGSSIAQLNEQMKVITQHVSERLPVRAQFMKTSQFGGFAVSMRDQLVGDVRTPLYVLQGGVLLVLLIACVNVANLLLMRATGRNRELAIRSTLGAGQWRIVRQMLTEGLVISAAGAISGVAVGRIGLRALVAMGDAQLPGMIGTSLDPIVLAFTFVLAVLTGLVFGIIPALAITRGNAAAFLKDDSRSGTASKSTGAVRTVLVVAETMFAVMLLIGAGLLIKSFAKLQNVNPGFSTENVLTAQIALPVARYPDAAAYRAFWARLLERTRAIPGVTSAATTTNVPFNGMVSSGSYSIVGRIAAPGEAAPHGRQEIVGGDYFKAMNIPLLSGRTFNDGDTIEAPPVCIVDEYLAKKYFNGTNALGQQIQRGGPTSPKFTIVGVVGTIHSIDLGQPVTKERLYYPLMQQSQARAGHALVLKTGLDPQTLVPQVRAAVRALDPEQPIADVRTMEQWVSRSLQNRRTNMLLLTVFGAVALVLSAIGIYGVLAFGVAQRVREFGIRQALGADQSSILSLVLKQGLRTAGLGVVLGLGASMGLARFLQTLLFGVTPHDPAVFAEVAAVLFAVAMAACYIPARRATRVDPMVALRDS